MKAEIRTPPKKVEFGKRQKTAQEKSREHKV